jgi:hypothetical protein
MLFHRLLGDAVKINDVTPLGCRKEVIKQCISDPADGRRKLFIIDGDINLVSKKEDLSSIDNLYVLERYCIENYVFQEECAIDYLYYECASKPLDLIKKELNYKIWLENYALSFVNLFIHFAIQHYFGGKFKLFNTFRYHSTISGKLRFNPSAISTDLEEIRKEILKLATKEEYLQKLQEFQETWPANIDTLEKIVSGKDYLLPLLTIKTSEFKSSKAMPAISELKFKLLRSCNLENLDELKKRLIAS